MAIIRFLINPDSTQYIKTWQHYCLNSIHLRAFNGSRQHVTMYINMDNTDLYKPALSPRVGTDPFLARISGWVKRENPKMHYITYINTYIGNNRILHVTLNIYRKIRCIIL